MEQSGLLHPWKNENSAYPGQRLGNNLSSILWICQGWNLRACVKVPLCITLTNPKNAAYICLPGEQDSGELVVNYFEKSAQQ